MMCPLCVGPRRCPPDRPLTKHGVVLPAPHGDLTRCTAGAGSEGLRHVPHCRGPCRRRRAQLRRQRQSAARFQVRVYLDPAGAAQNRNACGYEAACLRLLSLLPKDADIVRKESIGMSFWQARASALDFSYQSSCTPETRAGNM